MEWKLWKRLELKGKGEKVETVIEEKENLKATSRIVKKIPCEVYSRVVGYYRPVANWNLGKQQEFKERKTFKLK